MPTTAKELYRQLRVLPWEQLWLQEAARFDRASPEERSARVALIRAVGVVFCESGAPEHKEPVRCWLRALLHDPDEKTRRYAMAALPKIGAGPEDEAELLSLWRTATSGREKKFLMQTLEKIGGTATLQIMANGDPDVLLQAGQKIKAGLARRESPSAVRLDSLLADFSNLRIHLRGRRGLERIVRDEVEQSSRARGKFRVAGVRPGLVAVTPLAPFRLADLYALRCFGSVGFVIDTFPAAGRAEPGEALAAAIASPLSRRILQAFTRGAIRYRLNFVDKGHQRSAVRLLARRVYALCPEMLNDARQVTWTADIYPDGRGHSVELRPNLTPDPRFYYRRQDVPAASHPPLAACMARLAGRVQHEIVWDPFCGSGLELIECALLGGVERIHGTDRSAAAIAIARGNFAAAKVDPPPAEFTCCDFRDFATSAGLRPNSVSLVITNPPMGMRVPIADLPGLIKDLFNAAATVLRPGGRLVFANPLTVETPHPSLQLQFRQAVDFGGFDCRLEMYHKRAP
jgi:23S rRNA G2445 N2-methylase RlmL